MTGRFIRIQTDTGRRILHIIVNYYSRYYFNIEYIFRIVCIALSYRLYVFVLTTSIHIYMCIYCIHYIWSIASHFKYSSNYVCVQSYYIVHTIIILNIILKISSREVHRWLSIIQRYRSGLVFFFFFFQILGEATPERAPLVRFCYGV